VWVLGEDKTSNGVESFEVAVSTSAGTSTQVASQISRESLKAEIEELYHTNPWAALALAQKHNIKCVMYDDQVI